MDASFSDVEDGIKHLATEDPEPTSFFRFWKHHCDQFPLCIGKAGRICGDFHRLDFAPQKSAEILKVYPSIKMLRLLVVPAQLPI